MSSLWTPGGEVPVDRTDPSRSRQGDPAPSAEPDDAAAREQAAAIQDMLLRAPAGEVVAQHVVGLLELAALHLSQESPRLDDARVAIDAASAVLAAVASRLGPAANELEAATNQLKMTFVHVAGRPEPGSAEASADDTE